MSFREFPDHEQRTGQDTYVTYPSGGHVLGLATSDEVHLDGQRTQPLHSPVHRADVLRPGILGQGSALRNAIESCLITAGRDQCTWVGS